MRADGGGGAAGAAGADVVLLALEAAGGRLLLKLTQDTEGRAPALARGLGHTLAYLERPLPEALRGPVLDLGRAFGGLGGRPTPTGEAIAALERLARAGGATVRVHRAVPVGFRAPHWPVSLRSGAPRAGSLWPYDAELAGFALGRRRLTLREGLDEARAAADAAWLERRGLVTRRVGATLVGAADAATLDEAESLLPRVGARGEEGRDAERRLGGALGYPGCCVEAFVRLADRDDASLFAALLPAPPRPLPARGVWLSGAVTLISHAPCAPDCAATLALAAAVLAELERRHPGFAARWEELARRVHVLDARGRCLALRLRDGRVVEATELVPADPPDVARPAPDVVGVALEALPGRAVLVADHSA